MKDSENSHFVLFDPVRDHERRAYNDQLPRTRHTSFAPRTRVVRQPMSVTTPSSPVESRIDAPRAKPVHRWEIYERIRSQRPAGGCR